MADRMATGAVSQPEFAIERETIPDLDAEQPPAQTAELGLLGEGPISHGQAGRGRQPESWRRPRENLKRPAPGGDLQAPKRFRDGQMAPGRGLLDTPRRSQRSGWEGGFGESAEKWVGPEEHWDAPPGFTPGDRGNDSRGGEYVGGFGDSNGSNTGRAGPRSLLNVDTEREWDTPGRGGQFVGGGGSSNEGFVGGGDPNFVPTGGGRVVNRSVAASILEAAQGLMNTVQRDGPVGARTKETAAVQALDNNIRSLVNTLRVPMLMDPQRIMGQLSPQDRGFLREVELRTGIRDVALLARLVQTVRSLPDHACSVLATMSPVELLNSIGNDSPQHKDVARQILTLMGSGGLDGAAGGRGSVGPGGRPGLLGEYPMAMMRQHLGRGPGNVQSLLDMPVTFRKKLRQGHPGQRSTVAHPR